MQQQGPTNPLSLFSGIADRYSLQYSYEDSSGGLLKFVVPRQPKFSFELTLTLQDADELCIYVGGVSFSFTLFPQQKTIDRFAECVEGLVNGTVKVAIADRFGSPAHAALVRISDRKKLASYWRTFWPLGLRTTRTIQNQLSAGTLSPTALELAVFVETCKQLPQPDRAALEEQIEGITVRSRENTGAGFYTYFVLKSKLLRPIQTDTRHCYVTAKINGQEDALGFLLWLKEGYVHFLEGYTIALGSTVGMDFAHLKFELKSAPPIGN